MSRGTIQRSVRIADDIWNSAKTKAEDEGTTLSEVIRDALLSFINQK